mmetsp:Transcript_17587/g.51091  ORF Transcript_17587/g.51091 Transcript_17587/m.51091 type:complete len:496 (+) Transcript_17587:327-1814(+)
MGELSVPREHDDGVRARNGGTVAVNPPGGACRTSVWTLKGPSRDPRRRPAGGAPRRTRAPRRILLASALAEQVRPVGPPAAFLAPGPATGHGSAASLHLDLCVDGAHEPEASREAHRAGEDEEGVSGDEHVGHVHDDGDGPHHHHLGAQVDEGVAEEVDRRGPGGEVAAPPPVVVLGAELEVAHDDGDLRAGDHQDHEHEEEEAEDVVELVEPDGGEDEEELDEDRAEGQDAAHEHAEGRGHVPGLLRHLPRDLVGARGVLDDGLLVPEVGAYEGERYRDAEPHAEQCEEGAKGHGAGALLPPDEEVKDEADEAHDAREHEGCLERVALPVGAAKHLVETRRHVARGDTHEHIEQEHGGHQPTAVRWAQEAEQREDHGHEGHPEDLRAGPNVHRQEAKIGRGPEDVAVHQLPPGLLRRVFLGLGVVVPAQVAAERARHDHGHHATQEEHDHQAVHHGEPVDLLVAHEQVSVPAAGPLDVRSLPLDVVCEDDLARL